MTIQKLTMDEHYAELNKPGRYDAIRRGEMPIWEIGEETWEQFLNVLPPMAWKTYPDGVNSFMVSEAECGTDDGVAYQMYARHQGRFFSKTVILRDPATYITAKAIEDIQ